MPPKGFKGRTSMGDFPKGQMGAQLGPFREHPWPTMPKKKNNEVQKPKSRAPIPIKPRFQNSLWELPNKR